MKAMTKVCKKKTYGNKKLVDLLIHNLQLTLLKKPKNYRLV